MALERLSIVAKQADLEKTQDMQLSIPLEKPVKPSEVARLVVSFEFRSQELRD